MNTQTFDPTEQKRLGQQLVHVKAVMSDGQWRTLGKIKEDLDRAGCYASEPSISARLRDLRKSEFGGHTVERKRVPGKQGLYQYRLVPGEQP